jgi:hypothetical protein
MHKNEPKQESNQATLARVKKEMDEPRMAESTREQDVNQTTRQGLEKLQGERIMAKLTKPARDRISATKFAFPKQRKEPLENASHVRNAVARFNQVKGVTEAERRAAWKRIRSAAKRYAVDLKESA